MKKGLLASLGFALVCLATARPASADVLYTSGPTYVLNDGGLGISSLLYASQSFDPTKSGTATSVEFVAEFPSGGALSDISWSIGTTVDSSNLGSGTVDPSAVYLATDTSNIPYYSETFSIPSLSVTAGDTYYLTLTDAVDTNNTLSILWDSNGSSSTVYTGYQGGPAPQGGAYSVAFEVLSTSAATPEPSSLALFGTGVLGLVGVARRRLAGNGIAKE